MTIPLSAPPTAHDEVADHALARVEIDTLYTPLEEALEAQRARFADRPLRGRVAGLTDANPPLFLLNQPTAFYVRYLTTPNFEFQRFSGIVTNQGLVPVCLEFSRDKFVANNRDKYRLCSPAFETGPQQVRKFSIMNFGQSEGMRLADLNVTNGQTLPQFHGQLTRLANPDMADVVTDFSDWFHVACNPNAPHYYLHYLALFICDGILFENFLAEDVEERRFAREVVLPSFAAAVEFFGVRPLIVPLLPRESEGDDHWRRHPGHLYPAARNLLRETH